jgi:thiamine biosynthesis lipoprotein
MISIRIQLLLIITLFMAACQSETSYIHLNGFTMGTSYQITLQTDKKTAADIQQQIDSELLNINQLMSTYIDDSELSLFNQSNALDCQPLSEQTYYVIQNAIAVSKKTQGKFDVTLGPLILEWGFDKKQTNDRVPSQQAIDQLLQQIGFDKIKLGDHCIQKQLPDLSINLSAIAKGYGVDQIAKLLRDHQIEDYLVEIGGETASKGINPKSTPWRLAVEAPIEQKRQIQQVFSPLGLGVATSGDYRNYFEKNGVRFSHTIDPTTGKPISHKLVSVTVLHQQTMLADAYATAFMVMGEEQAIKFAEKNQLAAYLLVKTEKGFDAMYTSAFKRHLL